MAHTPEPIVDAIRNVHIMKFPATQTWNVFLTTRRVIFQLASDGTEEALFGIAGGAITRLFRSARSAHQYEPVESILCSSRETAVIDTDNGECAHREGSRFILSLPQGRSCKFEMSKKKMHRLQEHLASLGIRTAPTAHTSVLRHLPVSVWALLILLILGGLIVLWVSITT